MEATNYVVAGYKSWNRRVFDEIISRYPGTWHFIGRPDELNVEALRRLSPRYLFFTHWSWKVPSEIITHYACVCFHMTDVPYGRGGSPLQNLIIRGHRRTKLSALRMVETFDAGPVYLQEDLSLEGSAEEIYIRMSYLAAEMILTIINENPVPYPQSGDITMFRRRKPDESRIDGLQDLAALNDFIRMLDAEDYPRAFLEYNGFRYEFSRASLCDHHIVANIKITPLEENRS